MAMATPSASSSSIFSNSRACAKASSDSFPAGLSVLVVDDDPICLLILDRMLRQYQYQVTTCWRATEALEMLRKNRDKFDVIISNVYMPDMDGFKFLELVRLEMNLPVIMMSENGETSGVMKCIKHGACDYLLKPVRMEDLRNIWQHVVRKKWSNSGQTGSHEDDETRQVADDGDYKSSANEGLDKTWKQNEKRKDIKEEEEDDVLDNDDPSTTKKKLRVIWSVDLHQKFVNAVNQLGIDKAVPKQVLKLMNIRGLTRENVASHLQKYRLYLNGVAHQLGGLNPSFHTGQRTQGAWQGFGEYGQVSNSPIRSPSYSQTFSGSQNLNLGAGQEQCQLHPPGFRTGFSRNLSMDDGCVKGALSGQLSVEGSMNVKEEGHGWLREPLSCLLSPSYFVATPFNSVACIAWLLYRCVFN